MSLEIVGIGNENGTGENCPDSQYFGNSFDFGSDTGYGFGWASGSGLDCGAGDDVGNNSDHLVKIYTDSEMR